MSAGSGASRHLPKDATHDPRPGEKPQGRTDAEAGSSGRWLDRNSAWWPACAEGEKTSGEVSDEPVAGVRACQAASFSPAGDAGRSAVPRKGGHGPDAVAHRRSRRAPHKETGEVESDVRQFATQVRLTTDAAKPIRRGIANACLPETANRRSVR